MSILIQFALQTSENQDFKQFGIKIVIFLN